MTDYSKVSHTALFADKQYTFVLTTDGINELERLCGAGIGEIALRLGSLRYRRLDVREVVRLGLIGGGMPPMDAAGTVLTYVDGYPIDENLKLAADIIGACMYGSKLYRDALAGKATLPRIKVPDIKPPDMSVADIGNEGTPQ